MLFSATTWPGVDNVLIRRSDFSRRDKKSLKDYAFLWNVMSENINGSNSKGKPSFGDDYRGQVKSLKDLALQAVNNRVLIQRVNRKLTLDCSSENDTSGDSYICQPIECIVYGRQSLFHAMKHMKNIVLTMTDEAKNWIIATSVERNMSISTVSQHDPMPSDDMSSDDSDSVDKDIFMKELLATHDRSETVLCQNRVGYANTFMLEHNSCNFQAQLKIEMALMSEANIKQSEFDHVRSIIVRTCEETVENIKVQNVQKCGKRKLDLDDETVEVPRKQIRLKPRCSSILS